MPLYIKDPEVDRLAGRLAAQRRTTKTEVVRQALRREIACQEDPSEFVKRIQAFTAALEARAPRERGLPVDKAFIDSLYEDD